MPEMVSHIFDIQYIQPLYLLHLLSQGIWRPMLLLKVQMEVYQKMTWYIALHNCIFI